MSKTDKTIRLDGKSHKKAKIQAAKKEKTLMEYLADLITKDTDKQQ